MITWKSYLPSDALKDCDKLFFCSVLLFSLAPQPVNP